jgi:DNA repair protein RecN (Recombination protein N)
MLLELKIKNFIIIEDLGLEFGPGLNIFSGETGAGKSILIDAISGILGEKMTTSQIRGGYEKATLEGIFDIADQPRVREILEESGVDVDEPTLILRRELYSSGRGRCFANASQIPVSKLKAIGEYLIDIHGQNEHQSIVKVSRHRELLDSFAGTMDLVEQVRDLHGRLGEIRDRLESFEIDEKEKARRIEFNSFAVKEIEAASLTPGEEEELKNESNLLSNAEKLFQEINSSAQFMNAEGGVLQNLKKTEASLARISEYDPEISGILETIRESYYALEDAGAFLRNYENSIDFSPERINAVEERLSLISTLKKKYGDTIEEILGYADRANREIEAISSSEEEMEKLREEQKKLTREARDRALELSRKREEGARDLEARVMKELSDLAMGGTQFSISITQEETPDGEIESGNRRYALYPHGMDRVEFLLSANRGQNLRQLRKIASGGELSRIMLALKNVILSQDIVSTLIFDEVDAGIGGKTADIVGRKLKTLSHNSQVLLITHLPQIAAMSDSHYQVQKHDSANRTTTMVNRLKRKEKIREIARMLAGEKITETSLQHAEDLVARAEGR